MSGRTKETISKDECYHYQWKHELHAPPHIYLDVHGVKQAGLDWSTHPPAKFARPCRICGQRPILGQTDCDNRPCHKTCAEAELLARSS